jgi:cell division protein FtsB
MSAQEWTSIVTVLISSLTGGGIGWLVTLRAQRTKAVAESRGSELDNVEDAVKIWRELAESFRNELQQARADNCEITKQVDMLRREVVRLTRTNSDIIRMLKKLTPENLEESVRDIINEINQSHAS